MVTQNGEVFYKYKVQPGEGVFAVSRTFSVSVAEILRVNPEANKGLKNGQVLLIPVPKDMIAQSVSSTPTLNNGNGEQIPDQNLMFKHTVQKGETVYAIAQMYNTTTEEIYQNNPSAKEGLTEGQVLNIPQRQAISVVKEENYRYHTILPKETLYSVSKTYSLKPEDIITANPGLSASTFQIGKTIRIPFFETFEKFTPYQEQTTDIIHKVLKGETLYSISKSYGVSVQDLEQKNPMVSNGLKTNMELIIPVKSVLLDDSVSAKIENANLLLSGTKQSPKTQVMRVGLLMPFLDKTNNQNLRIQEFYEGFLLAVQKMKEQGANIDLYVFDIGAGKDTQKLESLLGTMEMQGLNLIVGGITDEQIKVLSDFSKERNIKYVIPISNNEKETLNNGQIFQINTLQDNLYAKASGIFLDTFNRANIVFVNDNTSRDNKMAFVKTLQNDLKKKNIKYQSIDMSARLDSTLVPLLAANKENVIIPTSDTSAALVSLMKSLTTLQESNPDYTTRLFGYPVWQTFDQKIKDDYHKFGTYIYTSFFVDENDQAVKDFNSDFKKWYQRDLINLYPRFGMHGYDIGMYFLTALYNNGINFDQNINRINVKPLQFAFYFERVNNWGGFRNTGIYLIHYDTNNMIYKIDKSK
ncbi:MAG: penicillin-binding protein activator [Dysgonamonadaceae bacterium]|nr:penicillin-binding protein activator [Dysgonamonadaceae bacterium]